jgi:hypothetical protein
MRLRRAGRRQEERAHAASFLAHGRHSIDEGWGKRLV